MFETMNKGLHFTKPTKVLKKQEISQINKSYESFIMDQSSSYSIRTYSYIETNMHLIYKNAFKRCINTCTFNDNLLFYICSVDGLNQILECFACTYIFIFINTMKDTINSTEFWNNSHMCLAMFHHLLTFLVRCCLSYVPTDNVSLAMNIWQRIFSKVCAFTQGKDFVK